MAIGNIAIIFELKVDSIGLIFHHITQFCR